MQKFSCRILLRAASEMNGKHRAIAMPMFHFISVEHLEDAVSVANLMITE